MNAKKLKEEFDRADLAFLKYKQDWDDFYNDIYNYHSLIRQIAIELLVLEVSDANDKALEFCFNSLLEIKIKVEDAWEKLDEDYVFFGALNNVENAFIATDVEKVMIYTLYTDVRIVLARIQEKRSLKRWLVTA